MHFERTVDAARSTERPSRPGSYRGLPPDRIETAATDIYRAGFHRSGRLRIRLVAVGRDRSEDIDAAYPQVKQLLWSEMLAFIWDRFHRYRQQKTQVDQWDAEGRKIKRLADQSGGSFVVRLDNEPPSDGI